MLSPCAAVMAVLASFLVRDDSWIHRRGMHLRGRGRESLRGENITQNHKNKLHEPPLNPLKYKKAKVEHMNPMPNIKLYVLH